MSASCELRSVPVLIPASPPSFTATIKAPDACSTGLPPGETAVAFGSYEGDLSGNELWVLLAAPNGELYPQTPDACEARPAEASNGEWRSKLQLSEKGHPPEVFDIVVTIAPADSEASRDFKKWLRAGCLEPGKFSRGFPTPPPGLFKATSITVRSGR